MSGVPGGERNEAPVGTVPADGALRLLKQPRGPRSPGPITRSYGLRAEPPHATERIDPLGPVPPDLQIAAIIKRGILSGQYPPDTRIPTESELVETYEVARSTARRAVAALREEGLVYTVQARGTYVARLDGEPW